MKNFFKFLASLKLAVFVIIGLALAQAIATFIESAHNTKAAQYWVYQSIWFFGLLFLLGVNIAAVALSRYPWKWRHGPFLTAHVGILTLLFGSFITHKFGVDGSLIVSEGESSTKVSFEKQVLIVSDGEKFSKHYIPWVPSNVNFKGFEIPEFDIHVEKFITHAEAVYDFKSIDKKSDLENVKIAPAIQFKLKGGPLPFSRVFWLWAGAPEWSQLPLGPARFEILPSGYKRADLKKLKVEGDSMGRFTFLSQEGGSLYYGVYSKKSEPKIGEVKFSSDSIEKINLGWMGMELEVKRYFPKAINNVYYKESRTQKGNEAPPSAIFVNVGDEKKVGTWLGMDDQAVLHYQGKKLVLTYTKEYLNTPFAIKLLRFNVEKYQGTTNPSSYSSNVQVQDGNEVLDPYTISMNEPLHYKGYTFYQASFIPGEPRPVTSVFSVNKDPGRFPKYLGSLLIVLGSIWLFSQRYRKKKKEVSHV